MKRLIIGLCTVVTGFILFTVLDEFRENQTSYTIDKMFSDQVFDEAQDKYTVHGMGLSPEEKILTVRIEKTQYKEQAEKYFRDTLDNYGMKSYELEVFADDLDLQ